MATRDLPRNLRAGLPTLRLPAGDPEALRLPEAEQQRQVGLRHFRQRQYGEAERQYLAALARDGLPSADAAVLHGHLADARLAASRWQDCIEACEGFSSCSGVMELDVSVKLKVDDRRARASRALVVADESATAAAAALAQGRLQDAARAFSTALEAADRSASKDPVRAELLYSKSEALVALSKLEPALADARHSLALRNSTQAVAQVSKISSMLEAARAGGAGSAAGAGEEALAEAAGQRSRCVRVCPDVEVVLREDCSGWPTTKWEAARLLAHWVASPRAQGHRAELDTIRQVSGRVLEIGAGPGLAGLAAAAAMPECMVALTDPDLAVVETLRVGIVLNGHSVSSRHKEPDHESRVHALHLDYAQPGPGAAGGPRGPGLGVFQLPPADLVLGAEVLDSDEQALALSEALGSLIAAPDGVAALCLRDRPCIGRFLSSCDMDGLWVEARPAAEPLLKLAREEICEEGLFRGASYTLLFVRHAAVSSSPPAWLGDVAPCP